MASLDMIEGTAQPVLPAGVKKRSADPRATIDEGMAAEISAALEAKDLTKEGAVRHKRVDKQVGVLPETLPDTGELKVRSVSLGSGSAAWADVVVAAGLPSRWGRRRS